MKTITIEISDEVRKMLKQQADVQGKKFSVYLREIMERVAKGEF